MNIFEGPGGVKVKQELLQEKIPVASPSKKTKQGGIIKLENDDESMKGSDEEIMEVESGDEKEVEIVKNTKQPEVQVVENQTTKKEAKGVDSLIEESDDEEQFEKKAKHLNDLLNNWEEEEAAKDRDKRHAMAFWNSIPATNIELDGGMWDHMYESGHIPLEMPTIKYIKTFNKAKE